MEDEEIQEQQPAVPSIQIANEVIASIAGLAAMHVEGVAGLQGGMAANLSDMLGRRSTSRGIRVDVEQRTIDLSLYLSVFYGVRIPEVAQKVQDQVKAQVEHMTGLRVRVVDIHIQGVTKDGESSVQPS